MSTLEVGHFFWLEIKKGEKGQNSWNNIKVISLSRLEIQIYMWLSNEMMHTLFCVKSDVM